MPTAATASGGRYAYNCFLLRRPLGGQPQSGNLQDQRKFHRGIYGFGDSP